MAAPIAERASRHDVVQWVRTAIGAGHQVLGSASEGKRLASRDAVSLAVSVDILEPHRQAASSNSSLAAGGMLDCVHARVLGTWASGVLRLERSPACSYGHARAPAATNGLAERTRRQTTNNPNPTRSQHRFQCRRCAGRTPTLRCSAVRRRAPSLLLGLRAANVLAALALGVCSERG